MESGIEVLPGAERAVVVEPLPRDHLRTLLEAAPDPVFVIGVDAPDAGRILDCNDLAANVHGYRRDELIGSLIAELDVPEDAGEVPARLARLLAQGMLHEQVRHRHRDGHRIPIEVSARLITLEGRRCALSFNRDVTEREAIEMKLAADKVRLELAARAGGIGLWDWDMVAGTVFFSDEWKAQIGFAPHEIEPRFEEWESRLHPDDRQHALAAVEDYLVGKTPRHSIEFRFRHKDGSWRWIYARGELMRGPDGRALRMVGSHVDFTDRRHAEERLREQEVVLRSFFDSPGVMRGIAELTEHDIIHVSDNRVTAAFFGTTVDRMAGRTASELGVPPETIARWRRHYLQSREEQRPVSFEYEHPTPTGALWMRATVCFIADLTSGRSRFAYAVLDTSAARKAEEQRSEMERQLLQLQKIEAIGTLASGIAHDFNNVLAAITGNLELAQADAQPGTSLHECLDEIRQASERGKSLVRQILSFGRADAVLRRPIALQGVVEESARFLRAALPSSQAIALRIDRDAPIVLADAAQIHQVLVNLCTNAAHAMEQKAGVLRLELSCVDVGLSEACRIEGLAPGPHACLCVSDEGCGMDAATLARAYEPFFTTKPVGKGTGLGLAVVKGIVRQHHGAIDLTSELGRGTTIRVYLPAAVGVEPRAAPDPAPATAVESRARLLLLDDEPALERAVKRNLERLGYVVSSFSVAADAFAEFVRHPDRFDVVLTDYEMPGCNGLTFARRIRSLRADLPILLLSGYLRPEVLEEAKRLDISRVLPKPISGNDLSAAIDEALCAARAKGG
ncbi:MAG: PAS domain S-box protein [Planctomycetes bacterium]|nr:PAS domain S-box protein [Planctomycetota bacterium]